MRWLHCSDFHIGKDRTAQEKLTSRIIDHVEKEVSKGFIPDFVFVTGDIANRANKNEYKNFRNEFFLPLKKVLGESWEGKIIVIPGNHDVDRTQNDTFDRNIPLDAKSPFFDPDKQGKTKREILMPRFKAYRQGSFSNIPGDWVSNPEGAFAEVYDFQDVQVGVVGINTAWLSKDGHDRHQLTPGIPLVEAALVKVKDCQICFVLGHHPLNWLHEENAQRLKALFGLHGVIYLHGHMHQADGSREDGAGNDFLVFQAGAAFQARDGEPWKNGLLWGKIDLSTGSALLSPRFWNPTNYDWPIETGRFPENRRKPGQDWWEYPLPSNRFVTSQRQPNGWTQPDGWEVITAEKMESFRHEVSVEEAERFFDGAESDWALALCPKLPRREKVGDLAQQLTRYQSKERPFVILLTGPGGEGKSMTLRQTIVKVLETDNTTKILWHDDETRFLPVESIVNLPEGPWIIATDAADMAAKSIFQLLGELRRSDRSDINFLLCARDTDWRASEAERLEWARYSTYRVETMSGLSKEDAKSIASSWNAFETGLKLSDAVIEEKGLALYKATQAEAAVSEGSMLGGILAVRYGDGLRAHVAKLLERLSGYPLAVGGTLYDAFAYIAVMHAEKFNFLSRPVLAKVLNINPRELGRQVIVPLAKEAAANGGTILLTRHRRIAETAVAIMQEEYGEDVSDRFVDLATAAQTIRQINNLPVVELHRWRYELPDTLLEREPETAVRIAKALYDLDTDNVRLVVNLARIFREAKVPDEGVEVLENFTGEIGYERGYWYEWSACLGNAGDYALNAILSGFSLVDQAVPSPANVKDAKLALAGIGVSFGELYQQFRDKRFLHGQSAVAFLGLQLDVDTVARSYFEKHKKESESAGASSPTDVVDGLSKLKDAINAAWEVSGKPSKLLERIAPPSSFSFNGLARLFSR